MSLARHGKSQDGSTKEMKGASGPFFNSPKLISLANASSGQRNEFLCSGEGEIKTGHPLEFLGRNGEKGMVGVKGGGDRRGRGGGWGGGESTRR